MNPYGINLDPKEYPELIKKRVMIGIPHNFNQIYNDFQDGLDAIKSFIGNNWHLVADCGRPKCMTWEDDNCGWMIRREARFNGATLFHGRNELAETAKIDGFDYLLMLDSDIGKFPPDLPFLMLKRMLENNIRVLSGLVQARQGASLLEKYNLDLIRFGYPIYSIENGLRIPHYNLKKNTGLFTAESLTVGAACLMIDVKIFNEISFPYFYYNAWYDDNRMLHETSEDNYFCLKVHDELKEPIYIDTDIYVSHKSLIDIPYDDYNLTQKQSRVMDEELEKKFKGGINGGQSK